MTRPVKRRYFTADLSAEVENGIALTSADDLIMNLAIAQAKKVHPRWNDNCQWRIMWIKPPLVKLCRESFS